MEMEFSRDTGPPVEVLVAMEGDSHEANVMLRTRKVAVNTTAEPTLYLTAGHVGVWGGRHGMVGKVGYG